MLGVGRERLLSDPSCAVQGPAVRAFQDAVRRRSVEREPVAYIIGRRGFRRIELAVDRRALIPRPETELLVEVGLGLPPARGCSISAPAAARSRLRSKSERPDCTSAAATSARLRSRWRERTRVGSSWMSAGCMLTC